MATPFVVPNAFVPNTVADANAVNANFDAVEVAINSGLPAGSLTENADLSALTQYNYQFFQTAAGGTSAAFNGLAMVNMLAAMGALNGGQGGGLGLFAAGNFDIVPGAGFGYQVPDQTVFQASGNTTGGGPAQAGFAMTADGTLFYCSGPHNGGGVYFRNLGLSCLSPLLTTTTGIYINYWNTVADSCTFYNFPTALNIQGLQSGPKGCTFRYNNGPNNAQQVIIGGHQNLCIGPGEFSQLERSSGGATGCSGISIQTSEHTVIAYHHIFYWDYGIDYAQNFGAKQNARFTHVTSVDLECWVNCVRMQLNATQGGVIFGEKYVGNMLKKSQHSTDSTAVVLIDTNGAANTNIDDIEFTNCTVIADTVNPQPNQYGYEIRNCGNVSIVGGYAGNCSSSGGAGIAITGNPNSVTITGTKLYPSYANANAPESSQYALFVSGSPVSLVVTGCDMLGYGGSGPVKITGTPQDVYIANCPGYNNMETVINVQAPTTMSNYAANQGTGPNTGTSYYGPSLVTFVNGVSPNTLHLNNTAHAIPANAFGSFYLNSPQDPFYFATAPATFTWVGK